MNISRSCSDTYYYLYKKCRRLRGRAIVISGAPSTAKRFSLLFLSLRAMPVKHAIYNDVCVCVSKVLLFTLVNAGISCSITNYGGTITHLLVPDRTGVSADVVLKKILFSFSNNYSRACCPLLNQFASSIDCFVYHAEVVVVVDLQIQHTVLLCGFTLLISLQDCLILLRAIFNYCPSLTTSVRRRCSGTTTWRGFGKVTATSMPSVAVWPTASRRCNFYYCYYY